MGEYIICGVDAHEASLDCRIGVDRGEYLSHLLHVLDYILGSNAEDLGHALGPPVVSVLQHEADVFGSGDNLEVVEKGYSQS